MKRWRHSKRRGSLSLMVGKINAVRGVPWSKSIFGIHSEWIHFGRQFQ